MKKVQKEDSLRLLPCYRCLVLSRFPSLTQLVTTHLMTTEVKLTRYSFSVYAH